MRPRECLTFGWEGGGEVAAQALASLTCVCRSCVLCLKPSGQDNAKRKWPSCKAVRVAVPNL